jgi:hypothetical protein
MKAKLYKAIKGMTRKDYDNLAEGETLILSKEVALYKYDHNYRSMSVYEDDEEEEALTHCVLQYNGEDIFVIQTNGEDALEFTDIYGI